MEVQVCWETVNEAATEVAVAPSYAGTGSAMEAFPEPQGW